jgi:hypothetical protein
VIKLNEPYNEIFDKIYDITEGNVIIGGSLSLKLQGVIDRDILDIDVNILKTDWDIYEYKLHKEFRLYRGYHIINERIGFNFEVYTGLNKNRCGEFHLFVNHISDIFNTILLDGKMFRVLKPEFMLKDKQWILETEPELIKHKEDIISIKKWLNEE